MDATLNADIDHGSLDVMKMALDKFCTQLRKNSKNGVDEVNVPPIFSSQLEPPPTSQFWRLIFESKLIQTLENSTVVSTLVIDLEKMIQVEFVRPFLPLLRRHRHLRRVELRCETIQVFYIGNVDTEVVQLLLDAINDNNHIDELHIDTTKAFGSTLQAIRNIRNLTIGGAFHWREQIRIGEVLKSNESLDKLTIHNVDNAQYLLQHLVSHPTMTSLTFGPTGTTRSLHYFHDALAPFLAASTTLQHLKLQGISFSGDIQNIAPIVEALQTNQSIDSLSLDNCRFSNDALNALAALLQSSDATTNGIRHLEMNSLTYPRGASLASFVASPDVSSSSLKSLTLTGQEPQFGALLMHLANASTTIAITRLPPRLHVRDSRLAGLRHLAVVLPSKAASTLVELTLSGLRRQGGFNNPIPVLVDALLQNWSVTRVTLTVQNDEAYFKKTAAEWKTIQAVCTRNATVPAFLSLLQGAPRPDTGAVANASTAIAATTAVDTSSMADTADATQHSPLDARVVPGMFVLMAKQAPTSELVLKGMFAMEEDVLNVFRQRHYSGAAAGAKRARFK